LRHPPDLLFNVEECRILTDQLMQVAFIGFSRSLRGGRIKDATHASVHFLFTNRTDEKIPDPRTQGFDTTEIFGTNHRQDWNSTVPGVQLGKNTLRSR